MNRTIFRLALIVMMLPLIFACDEVDEPQADISGSWTRIHAVTNIPVRITFLADGTFTFEPLIATDLHSASEGSYKVKGSELTFFADDDCQDMDGTYRMNVKCDTFDAETLSDGCEPRNVTIEGRWMRE